MRQSTYLNVILTVNAVLLAGLLWTQISSGTGFAEPAVAQVRSTPQGQRTVTPPNAADQRKRMGDTLKEIKRSVDATRKLLESGNVKVEVTNLSEIRVDGSDEP